MSSAPLLWKVAALIWCIAEVCLSYTLTHQNPITLVTDHPHFSSLGINAIYQFGDSISDTGNLFRVEPSINCGKWPYGKSLSQQPTGRCSDGLLMIDIFAKFLNMPLIDVYLNKDGNFSQGVNFAVSGSTTLDVSILEDKYSIPMSTNLSLSVQLEWFKTHVYSYYPNETERRNTLAKGLFFMGEIGGNDLFYAFSRGLTLPNIYSIMLLGVQAIKNAVEEIIVLGATQIIIPGNFPIGCMPIYLALFKTNDQNMYDDMRCLKEYNKHVQFYNDQLQQTIIGLQNDHPNVTIVYMDYFGAIMDILQNAASLGFDETVLQKACCGASDGEYNVKVDTYCGCEGGFVCEEPEKYVSWDGTHFTQQAYHVMAKELIPSFLSALRNVA